MDHRRRHRTPVQILSLASLETRRWHLRHMCHRGACPIEDWPTLPELLPVADKDLLRHDPSLDATRGPLSVQHNAPPETVWLTAESLGDSDPALVAHPNLPVVFVFDDRLLTSIRLSGKRLIFLADRPAELAAQRDLAIYLSTRSRCCPTGRLRPRSHPSRAGKPKPPPWPRPRSTPGPGSDPPPPAPYPASAPGSALRLDYCPA